MTEFTPGPAALGGLLIGLSAALLLLASGRVAGISGIVAQLVWPDAGEARGWRLAFVAGLPLGALIVHLAFDPLAPQIETGPTGLVAAGLLVGFGSRLGSGCTSGHGVCGISRGSGRSISATLTFMGAAALTVFVTRHLIGGLS